MTPRPFRLWLLASAASAATLALQAQPAPQNPAPVTPPATAAETTPLPELTPRTPPPLASLAIDPNAMEEISFPDTPLHLVLQAVESYTGRTVIRQAGLPNPSLTIQFKRPVTRAEILQAIDTSMNLNQITMIPLGEKFLKVVPIGMAKVEGTEFIEGSTLGFPPSGRLATKLFQLEFLRIGEFQPQLGQMINTNNGAIVNFDKANALLITESISTLQRIELLIQKLDRPIASGIVTKFYSLRNGAKASDLVNKLNAIVKGSGPVSSLGTATTLNADDRTNQIVLFADARQIPLFDELIAKLDVKADPNTRNEVIYLKHAAAEEVETLLTAIISGQTSKASQGANSRSGIIFPNQPQMPAAPGANVPLPQVTVSGADSGGNSSNEFSTIITIKADKRSNAVVVSGTVDDLRLIKELVDKIDIILPQVRIEVVIAEVALDNDASTGISSLGLAVENGKVTGFTATAAGLAVGAAAGTGNTPSIPTGFAAVAGRYDLTGVIQLGASATKTSTRILATTTLMTTHNKKATLFVGENRPSFGQVQTVDSTSGGTANNASALRSAVTSQEAGTNLTITPLIGADGTVQLEIEQKFNAFGPQVNLGSDLSQASINRRETTSYISVSDGEIIVLGGYRAESNTRSRSRLGPIPIIGDILGARNNRVVRTELIAFIRPHVVLNVDKTTPDAHAIIEGNANLRAVRDRIDPTLPPPVPEKEVKAGNSPSLRRPK